MSLPPSGRISSTLRERLISWNQLWQSELDPVRDARWSNADVGRGWVVEGQELVSDLQTELGPQVRVIGDFAGYGPDRA